MSEYVYRFADLSPRAKDRVREAYCEQEDWSRGGEYLDSLKALAEHFGGRLADWDIDWTGGCYSSVQFDMPELVDEVYAEDETGQIDEDRLYELRRREIERRLDELGEYDPVTLKGTGECKLTGTTWDDDAIDGFRKAFVEGETDLKSLMEAAFRSLLKATTAEYDYAVSDEGLAENLADDWFDAKGRQTGAPDSGKGRYSKDMLTEPHGRCRPGRCVEHAADRRVPSCQRGRRKGRR